MESLKGKFLLASSRLLDPNFARTIVLIIQHDENGAMGLIVNQALDVSIDDVCRETLNIICSADGNLHRGGPCEGMVTVISTSELANQVEVIDGVYFTMDRTHIESLLLHGTATMKWFVGYAGWTEGQLEAEIKIGSWLTADADKDIIFNPEAGEEAWQKLITRLTLGQWIDPSRIPEDPNMN